VGLTLTLTLTLTLAAMLRLLPSQSLQSPSPTRPVQLPLLLALVLPVSQLVPAALKTSPIAPPRPPKMVLVAARRTRFASPGTAESLALERA
jgi:hypothetical protein